ncbi:hypothetical protein NMY22_g6819 [Coprinellus aureogranulatus]|nr:hypothetical protein NMY22_g6819 [Coprinellus aureogranulatus]
MVVKSIADELHRGLIMEWLYGSGKVALLYYYATTFDEEVSGVRIYSLVAPTNDGRPDIGEQYLAATGTEAWEATIPGQYNQLGHDERKNMPDTFRGKLLHDNHQTKLFWVPIAVLGYITVKSERYIPRVQIDIIGGYPCSFVVDPINPAIRSVASYLVAIRAFRALRLYSTECHKAQARVYTIAVLLIACIFVLYRRYHYRKFNNLLGVIQREGGIYLFAQVVIDVIAGLKSTKSITISDPYGIVSMSVSLPRSSVAHLLSTHDSVRVCIPPIFADRLLLKMHHKEDSEATIVSTMRFDRGPPDPEETLDEGATRAENEKCVLCPSHSMSKMNRLAQSNRPERRTCVFEEFSFRSYRCEHIGLTLLSPSGAFDCCRVPSKRHASGEFLGLG